LLLFVVAVLWCCCAVLWLCCGCALLCYALVLHCAVVNPANSSKVVLDEHGLLLIKDCIMIDDCKTAQDMIDRTTIYEKERHSRATPLNPDSSRGHMVFGLIVERTEKLPPGKKGKLQVVSGKLSLIDLAGSEDPRKTGTVRCVVLCCAVAVLCCAALRHAFLIPNTL
jgi:hypothetical protein